MALPWTIGNLEDDITQMKVRCSLSSLRTLYAYQTEVKTMNEKVGEFERVYVELLI